jgi:RNA polymerase sigma-70 factor (ECF subfamily)
MSRWAATADEVLVRRLFREHGAALIAYATRLLDDRTAADDVVRECLVRAWRDPEILTREKGAVRGHLFVTARDLVAQRRHPAGEPGPEPEPEPAFDGLAVLNAVEALPAEHRDVLHALYFEGRDVDEAAVSLGVPAGAMKTRSYHALRRLRAAVAG